ncbi:hypothetical protein IFM58399_03670 [Aspergillus lentulus]|uniref:Kelch repeat-containing protein n=1 Tax=Aspergillus lentulus TaxID=293939 RepID=UPI001394EF2D|nr:uncharacterized protein IFM58399_03670 [Aspergillus lentulus]GFF33818.1 hypothetical protein IFM58399_03670 [Aspergillus lentulus]
MGTFGTIGFGYVNLIESAGDQGLVAFGGYTYPGGEKLSVLAARQNDTTRQNSMEFVRVYDIPNKKWYTQQTRGDIPRWRMAGCIVVVPDDLSSYSIYVFRGMAQNTGDSDGDVYVLSIPSFQWIRVYETILSDTSTNASSSINIPCMQLRHHDFCQRNRETCRLSPGEQSTTQGILKDARFHLRFRKRSAGSNRGATLTEHKNSFNSTQLACSFRKRSVQPTSTQSHPALPQHPHHYPLNSRIIAVIISRRHSRSNCRSVTGAAAIGALAFFLLVLLRRRQAKLTKQSIPSWVNLRAGKPLKRPRFT